MDNCIRCHNRSGRIGISYMGIFEAEGYGTPYKAGKVSEKKLPGDRFYQELPALHQYDFAGKGFEWIDCHDSSQSVISYLRKSDDGYVVVVLNFTPVVREQYRIGVPELTRYSEVFNSDSIFCLCFFAI